MSNFTINLDNTITNSLGQKVGAVDSFGRVYDHYGISTVNNIIGGSIIGGHGNFIGTANNNNLIPPMPIHPVGW